MTAAEYRDLDRDQLLSRLTALNAMIARLGGQPYAVATEAREADLPLDNLRDVVTAEADHVTALAKAQNGYVG
jgi:hypothetical protein